MSSALQRTISHYFLIGFISFIPAVLMAQTYATPQMEHDAKHEAAAKNERLGNINVTVPILGTIVTSTKVFDAALLSGTFQLQKIEAIDYSGMHSTAEMKLFAIEARSEFDSKHIAIDLSKNHFYLISKQKDNEYGEIPILIIGDQLVFKNCIPCQDNTFKVVMHNERMLVLEVNPQDEKQHFTYRYTFTK